MFTGIVTHIGRVAEVRDGGVRDVVVESALPLDDLALGASVMHGGVCLTVVEKGQGWHRTQVGPETLARTSAGTWVAGTRLNLERSLRLGDELGGHLVFGHVDAVARVLSVEDEGESWCVEVELQASLAALVAEKGSIAVDGISLTVNAAGRDRFRLGIVPHTWASTTLAERRAGDAVNLEVDMLARYVARRLAVRDGPAFSDGNAADAR